MLASAGREARSALALRSAAAFGGSVETGPKTRYITVKGKRQDADRELTKLLAEANDGTLHIKAWPDGGHQLAPETVERYRELAENQIYPHLGAITLQKLKPARVAKWHCDLLKAGSRKDRPLSARTVGHAHRVLHRGLQRAV